MQEYTAHDEHNLQWFLRLIQGTQWPYSKGLTSFDRPDPDAQGLHHACLELERRGLILRVYAQGALVGWMSKG